MLNHKQRTSLALLSVASSKTIETLHQLSPLLPCGVRANACHGLPRFCSAWDRSFLRQEASLSFQTFDTLRFNRQKYNNYAKALKSLNK